MLFLRLRVVVVRPAGLSSGVGWIDLVVAAGCVGAVVEGWVDCCVVAARDVDDVADDGTCAVAGLATAAVVIAGVGFAAEWCGVMCDVDCGVVVVVVVVVVAVCWVAALKNTVMDAVGLICCCIIGRGS